MAKKFGDDPYYSDYQQSLFSQHYPPGKPYGSCYETHKPLALAGGKFVGGSCSRPITDTADVYIGFDRSMKVQETLPWERQTIQVLYPITDMHCPSNSKSFIQLVDWAVEQLQQGKTVHAGCIGGHGRTGTFLAALWAVVNNDKDAIEAVRKAYCVKAVESSSQVQFLVKHFGLNKAKGAKEGLGSKAGSGWNTGAGWKAPASSGGREFKSVSKPQDGLMFKNAQAVFNPVKSTSCVFGTVF